MGRVRRLWAAIADGGWLTERRVLHYPALAIVGTIIGTILGLAVLRWRGIEIEGDVRFGIDFVLHSSVARLAADGRAAMAYDVKLLGQFQSDFSDYPNITLPFFYPPTYFLVVYPLSLLTSYWGAFVAWISLTGAGYLLALWRAWPGWRTMWVGIASPIVLIVVANGQNGFLSAALLGGSLVLLPSRPVLAGVLMGLMTVKPHLGILVPLAFIAGRQWTAIVSAAATAMGLALVSAVVFGFDLWKIYLDGGWRGYHLLHDDWLPTWKIQSVYAAAAIAGASEIVAQAFQAVAFAAAATAVVWTWHRDVDHRLKTAVLLFATPLAVPYVHDYDLPFIAIGVASFAHYGVERGFRSYEKTLMAMVWLLPIVARPVPYATPVTLTPWVMAAGLALVMRRVTRDQCAQNTVNAKKSVV